jgi:pimeloyl-ACP methyl ester carboxylesterase
VVPPEGKENPGDDPCIAEKRERPVPDPGRVRLFSTTLGTAGAPAVLLVHGWGGDGREWSPHAEALAGHARVIVPDLRGHGRSEVPEEGNTPAEMADDLAALFASNDPEEIVTLADRCLIVARGRIVGELSGTELTEQALLSAVHDPQIAEGAA